MGRKTFVGACEMNERLQASGTNSLFLVVSTRARVMITVRHPSASQAGESRFAMQTLSLSSEQSISLLAVLDKKER